MEYANTRQSGYGAIAFSEPTLTPDLSAALDPCPDADTTWIEARYFVTQRLTQIVDASDGYVVPSSDLEVGHE